LAAARAADHPEPFEGHIFAEYGTGDSLTALKYTVSARHVRIELAAANTSEPIDLIDLQSNSITLLFPHNLTFTRLEPLPPGAATSQAGPVIPSPPPGIGAQAGVDPVPVIPNSDRLPALPPIPNIASITPVASQQLADTKETKVILGVECRRYELKQPLETLEIWATDKLIPFRAYVRGEPPRFGPRLIDEQWPAMMQERKLFPLLVSLRYPNGTERFRFEVKSIKPEKIEDPEGRLFQAPADYVELQPSPF